MNRNAVRIQDKGLCRFSRPDGFDRRILHGITHNHRARAHTGEVPGLVIFRDHQVFQDLAVRYRNAAQPIGETCEVDDVQEAFP